MRSERHWSIYLPALTISVLWAGVLFWADGREPPLETLRLLALIVEGIGVPLLFVWAFFRGRGAEIMVGADTVTVSTGGRHSRQVALPLRAIIDVRVAHSFLQGLVGAGRIEILTADGENFLLDDMGAPEQISEVITSAKSAVKQ